MVARAGGLMRRAGGASAAPRSRIAPPRRRSRSGRSSLAYVVGVAWAVAMLGLYRVYTAAAQSQSADPRAADPRLRSAAARASLPAGAAPAFSAGDAAALFRDVGRAPGIPLAAGPPPRDAGGESAAAAAADRESAAATAVAREAAAAAATASSAAASAPLSVEQKRSAALDARTADGRDADRVAYNTWGHCGDRYAFTCPHGFADYAARAPPPPPFGRPVDAQRRLLAGLDGGGGDAEELATFNAIQAALATGFAAGAKRRAGAAAAACARARPIVDRSERCGRTRWFAVPLGARKDMRYITDTLLSLGLCHYAKNETAPRDGLVDVYFGESFGSRLGGHATWMRDFSPAFADDAAVGSMPVWNPNRFKIPST